jgi:hypothetical protein
MPVLADQEIVDAIQAGEERPDLDYKLDIDLTGDKKGKAEITKDVIAMANSGGGLLIGGVSEEPAGFRRKGMPEGSLEAFDSTALNDFANNYSDPPINATTRKVTVEGKTYGIVIVPEFDRQPHIVIKDYPDVLREGDVLVRSASNNSVRAGPHDMRDLINLAISRRQGALKGLLQAALKSTRPALVGEAVSVVDSAEVPFDQSEYEGQYQGFRIVKIEPVDKRHQVAPRQLKPAAQEAAIYDQRKTLERFPYIRFSRAAEKRLPVGLALETNPEHSRILVFLFLGVHGEVFYVESLWEDVKWQPEDAGKLGLFSTIQVIFSGMLFAKQYYQALGFDGQIALQYSQESSVPRAVVRDSPDYWPFAPTYGADMSTPVTVDRRIAVDTGLDSMEEIAKDMIIDFFWYFYLDLNEGQAEEFLQYVKEKRIPIPSDLDSQS